MPTIKSSKNKKIVNLIVKFEYSRDFAQKIKYYTGFNIRQFFDSYQLMISYEDENLEDIRHDSSMTIDNEYVNYNLSFYGYGNVQLVLMIKSIIELNPFTMDIITNNTVIIDTWSDINQYDSIIRIWSSQKLQEYETYLQNENVYIIDKNIGLTQKNISNHNIYIYIIQIGIYIIGLIII